MLCLLLQSKQENSTQCMPPDRQLCPYDLQHPNLPGKSSADTTDKSDAPKGYDPNPNLMMDKNLANKPNDKQDRDSKKDGEVVDQDNTISSSSKQPRKAPEDVAPETAGS